jgi:hypothetical protein
MRTMVIHGSLSLPDERATSRMGLIVEQIKTLRDTSSLPLAG